MDTLKVLLVDDMTLFVESLKSVIESRAKDIRVIGIAADGCQALRCVEKERPSIVLMDVRMPNMDGVEATRIICKKYPDIKVIMLTTFDDDDYVYRALTNGACGYLLKDIPPDDLIASIREVNKSSVLISPSIAKRLIQLLSQHERNRAANLQIGNTLSKREKEVLILLAQGFSNKEIARSLFLAEQTIKNYISDIYSKIGTNRRIRMIKLINEPNEERIDDDT